MNPDQDEVLVAVSEDGRLRGRAARTTRSVREAIRRHQPTPLGALALARALSCAAVFPATWKDSDRVALQWSGDGPLKTVLAEIRSSGAVRAMISQPAVGPGAIVGARGLGPALGRTGFVAVTRQDIRGTFTRGQSDLVSGEIDEDLDGFFEASDQVSTRVRTLEAFGDDGALVASSAVLVQALPDGEPAPMVAPERLLTALPHAPLPDLLALAFGQPFEILDSHPVRFQCTCDRERVAAGVALVDVDELLDMINEDQGAVVRCDFCAEVYRFNRDELEQIMVKKVTGSDE